MLNEYNSDDGQQLDPSGSLLDLKTIFGFGLWVFGWMLLFPPVGYYGRYQPSLHSDTLTCFAL
jgi:hypothetical protein